jgi:hypothetical protein
MDRYQVLLNRNIARLRRDVRLRACEIEQLIAADRDYTRGATADAGACVPPTFCIYPHYSARPRPRLSGSASSQFPRNYWEMPSK